MERVQVALHKQLTLANAPADESDSNTISKVAHAQRARARAYAALAHLHLHLPPLMSWALSFLIVSLPTSCAERRVGRERGDTRGGL